MRIAAYSSYGGPEVMEIYEAPIPNPKKGQVLIRMVSTSVNGGDLQARAGKAKFRTALTLEWPKRLGMDIVGIVAEVGLGVTAPQVGDLVWGVTVEGVSYSEYVVMKATDVGLVPEGLDPIQAGALPVVATTALYALVEKAKVEAGQRLLVRGSGGVGLTAIQVAHARGAYVTALASKGILDDLTAQGADVALDYRAAGPGDF